MTTRPVGDAPQATQPDAAILRQRLELVENHRNTTENPVAIAAGLFIFRKAFLNSGQHHQRARTFGNAVCPMDAGEPDQLLELADIAMCDARAQRGGTN